MVLLHTTLTLLSYVAFLLAFVVGILFLVQERQVKHKYMGRLFHGLPSLGSLDRVNFVALGIGFSLLSIGLVCGFIGARRVLGQWWTWDSKELFALVMWAAYLILWQLRLRATVRGRKVALFSVLGFLLVLMTVFGARYWLPSWHRYL